ncbi:MAG: MarC family protein [Gemmatimonadales bacterium]
MSAFALFCISLFSVVNPVSAIPTFIGLTADLPEPMKRKSINRTATAVFTILAASYLTGEGLLRFFSIGVPSLQVAGGVVIMAMAWSMLHGRVSATKQTQDEVLESAGRTEVAIVPMAMPLLSGPVSISLMIIVAGRTTGVINHALVLLAALLVSLFTWVILLSAGPITRGLGTTGMRVATRIMGLPADEAQPAAMSHLGCSPPRRILRSPCRGTWQGTGGSVRRRPQKSSACQGAAGTPSGGSSRRS